MSVSVFILGESGTGKTASMRNLNPEDVCLIQAVKKPLPFRPKGWKAAAEKDEKGSLKKSGRFREYLHYRRFPTNLHDSAKDKQGHHHH